ncbi:MAG: drug:proton antiporter [Acidimicrobiaceae bacterium]|nr:drug:proton antiporter [Acidimicrobiaceae bacterium]|tara:strand:- start:12430 stop:14460 length:2031 start_codon:yes stop_codon:yes gene_type:complete
MSEENLVFFTPSGLRGKFADGTTVLDAARHLGVDLDSVCGGRGICGRCQVQPMFGEFAKHGISSQEIGLSPQGSKETSYKGRRALEEGSRLGCAATIHGDVVVDIPEESQVHRQVVRKEIDLGEVVLDPVLKLFFIELETGAPSKLKEEALDALEVQWGFTDLLFEVDEAALNNNSQADLKTVTVGIRDKQKIVAIWPGLQERVLGVGVDVGSTTIAGHLCDLTTGAVLATAGIMNPQIRFGEDLMSRVSYAMMNPGGEIEMTKAVREALNGLIEELCRETEAKKEEILEITLVGNPVMHHLFLGLDPIPLGQAPFTLGLKDAANFTADELELSCHSATRVHVLPCIAGHVGADTAAVILATQLHEYGEDEVIAIVDVGTNAEIVLSGKNRVLAASSPTGPAFEGAQISSGQRATPGAIERVRIDPATGEPRFKVLGVDMWSDEPGFDEAVSSTGVTGICGSGIIEVIAEMYLSRIISTDGIIGGTESLSTPRLRPNERTVQYLLYESDEENSSIFVTQNDVRAIQLAKAALYAGIRLLMDHLAIEKVDYINLAGAFGSHIDTIHATVLGLIPDCDQDRVKAVGNAAGTGAVIALLSGQARTEIQELVNQIEKVETATEPDFQMHFVEAMAIPHLSSEYPELSKVVTLPERDKNSSENRGARRRRSRSAAERGKNE